MSEPLTRRGLRHTLLRARNDRIAASRDESWPRLLVMSHLTLTELLVDDDPAEAFTVDFEGKRFMGILILADEETPYGDVVVEWPTTQEKEAPHGG